MVPDGFPGQVVGEVTILHQLLADSPSPSLRTRRGPEGLVTHLGALVRIGAALKLSLGVSMSTYASEKWIELYYAALVERRQTRIRTRVEAARIEIADRLTRLEGVTDSSEERGAITAALNALSFVESQTRKPLYAD